ncbi:hypothetical protein [Xenorhabdus bovienii]|uniref:hypothetical protein n=1 Tax=Xenorhabdus bovienii TaxID=40576 RepID=UPI0023B27F37|nr:hypothetical protein [Xenorhabdus bovienii]
MSNVLTLGIDQNQYLRNRVLAMLHNGDYTTPRFPFHFHFDIDGKEYVWSGLEISGLQDYVNTECKGGK